MQFVQLCFPKQRISYTLENVSRFPAHRGSYTLQFYKLFLSPDRGVPVHCLIVSCSPPEGGVLLYCLIFSFLGQQCGKGVGGQGNGRGGSQPCLQAMPPGRFPQGGQQPGHAPRDVPPGVPDQCHQRHALPRPSFPKVTKSEIRFRPQRFEKCTVLFTHFVAEQVEGTFHFCKSGRYLSLFQKWNAPFTSCFPAWRVPFTSIFQSGRYLHFIIFLVESTFHFSNK